jgi:hypothetical protein
MKWKVDRWLTLLVLAVAVGVLSVWLPLEGAAPTVPISMIVSVEAKHGKEIPAINREDVIVFQERDRVQVKDWAPLEQPGQGGGLELFLLIDDSTDTSLGGQLEDLRKFILQQPQSTKIAVGYIRNGSVNVVQNLTDDHALAAKALRLPTGSPSALESPYTAITDLVKRWPESGASREIVLVSSGIDQLEPGASDPYLDEAIDHAQRGGVQVYSIYAAPSGHAGHSFWRLTLAQSNLSRLADETGAEAYILGFEMPVAFAPYLEQIAGRLKHQYRLTFLAKAGNKAGFQRIRLETEVPNAELVAQPRVYIPALK